MLIPAHSKVQPGRALTELDRPGNVVCGGILEAELTAAMSSEPKEFS